MKDVLTQKAHNFVETYKTLYDNYKWSENDMFLRMASLIYASNDKKFDLDQFKSTLDYIKNHTSAFSSIRSYGRSTITSMLINNFENPADAFDSLLQCCRILKDNKMGSDIYAALSSVVIMLSGIEGQELDLRLDRAKNIFSLIKKRHSMLTTRGDYPMIFSLAGLDMDESVIEQKVDEFYKRLSTSGFKKVNTLLKTAEILAYTLCNIDEAVDKCSQLQSRFKEEKLPTGTSHYMQLGLLSLSSADPAEIVHTTKEVYEFLKGQERSKWLYSKQTVALEALGLVASDAVRELYMQGTAQAGMGAAIQSMVEAQQMATIAAVSASTTAMIAASSSSVH